MCEDYNLFAKSLLLTAFCSPPKYICWNPNPHTSECDAIWKQTFKEVIIFKQSHDNEPLSNLSSALRRWNLDPWRDPGVCVHRGKTTWGHSKEVATCKPRKEASEETTPVNIVIWISKIQNREGKFLLGYFLNDSHSKIICGLNWLKLPLNRAF